MSFLRPKFITFDCYGTLTNFHMGTMTREPVSYTHLTLPTILLV